MMADPSARAQVSRAAGKPSEVADVIVTPLPARAEGGIGGGGGGDANDGRGGGGMGIGGDMMERISRGPQSTSPNRDRRGYTPPRGRHRRSRCLLSIHMCWRMSLSRSSWSLRLQSLSPHWSWHW